VHEDINILILPVRGLSRLSFSRNTSFYTRKSSCMPDWAGLGHKSKAGGTLGLLLKSALFDILRLYFPQMKDAGL